MWGRLNFHWVGFHWDSTVDSLDEEQQTVLVVCLLKSIIEDQNTEAQRMGISVTSAANVSNEGLQTADFQRANARQHFPCSVSLFVYFTTFSR